MKSSRLLSTSAILSTALFLVAASPALASRPTGGEAQMGPSELPRSTLESATGAQLSSHEAQQFELFQRLSQDLNVSRQTADLSGTATAAANSQAALLFCAQAKGAVILRLQAAACITDSREVLLIAGRGAGLSAGAALSGLIGIYKGPLSSLKGQYSLMTFGGSGAEIFSKLPS